MEGDYQVPAKKSRSKPKVLKEWEEEDVYKLIALVEVETSLWNAGDEGYHNKIIRDNAWRNICESFHSKYGVADLNAKWTNLRIQFRGYAGRAKTKSGQAAMELPKWKYYSAMSFIGRAEELQTEATVSNLVLEIESDSNSLDNSATCLSTPPLSTPRRTNVGNVAASTQIAETMREVVATIKERNQNSIDPNTSFANYLISELRTVDNETAASIRRKVTVFFMQCLEEGR